MENKINYAAMSADDIIFIDRNKEYGAYELRRDYPQHVRHALLGTLLFTAMAVAYQNIYAYRHPFSTAQTIETVINLAKIQNLEIKTPTLPTPPTPPTQPQPKHGNPNAATAAVALYRPTTDREDLRDTVSAPDPNVDLSDHAQTGIAGEQAGTEKGTGVTDIHVSAPPAEPETVSIAEFMPEYPGGEDALLRFLGSQIEYPDYEKEAGIQGKAFVGFVVDENGKVTNVHMVRGVSKGIDNEAMRVVKKLHDFKPGMQSKRKVRVSFVIPLDFRLAGD